MHPADVLDMPTELFLACVAWLEKERDNPSRTDYHIMRVAQVIAGDGDLEDFRVRYVVREQPKPEDSELDGPPEFTDEMYEKAVTQHNIAASGIKGLTVMKEIPEAYLTHYAKR